MIGTSQAGRKVSWLFGAFVSFMVLCAAAQAVPKRRVPDKSALKAKVAELYRAQRANDEQAMRALILPQIIKCGFISHHHYDDILRDATPPQIIAWKIQSIEFDLHNFDEIDELCPGQVVHATAGALVVIEQTDREQGKEASTGELDQPWLYVDGTWYWLVDVD